MELLVFPPVPHSKYASDERQWNNTDSILRWLLCENKLSAVSTIRCLKKSSYGYKSAAPHALGSPSSPRPLVFSGILLHRRCRTCDLRMRWAYAPMTCCTWSLMVLTILPTDLKYEAWAIVIVHSMYVRTVNKVTTSYSCYVSAPKRVSAAYLSLWGLLTTGKWIEDYRLYGPLLVLTNASIAVGGNIMYICLLYTSPSPRD